jgi:hypothetical protein
MRRLDRILKRVQSTNRRLNAFQIVGCVVTPARDDSYAGRYTRSIHAASATQCTSRQTDFKRHSLQRIVPFCHALSGLSVTGQQRFNVSGASRFQRRLRAANIEAR